MQISRKQLSAMNWRLAFAADGATKIKVFKSVTHDDIAIIHTRETGKKTVIIYNVKGHRTTSPSEAIRIYNRAEANGMRGRSRSPGMPKSAAAREGTLP